MMIRAIVTFILAIILLSACGKGKSVTQLATEVCDCYKKGNSMDPADAGRTAFQNDCMKKQFAAWNTVKDNKEKADEYNKLIGECGTELIRKSFGQ